MAWILLPKIGMAADDSTEKTVSMASPSPWKEKSLGQVISNPQTETIKHDSKRVSTGIPDLDSLIEGGFPVGKSYLVAGEQGSGKTVFCIQFILASLLSGEKAVYVTLNERPADIVAEASSLGWSLLKYVEEKKLLILDVSPLLPAGTGVAHKGEGPDVVKVVTDLAGYVKRMEASRIVIDPIGPLIGANDSLPPTRETTRTLVHTLQDNFSTTNLLTSNCYTGNGIGSAGEHGIPVNGVVVLGFSEKKNGLIRTLLVNKMRGTATDLNEHPFNIVKGEGIVLKPIPAEAATAADATEQSASPAPSIQQDGPAIFKAWEP